MLTSFSDIWRSYRWDPELWELFKTTGLARDVGPDIQKLILASPLCRTMLGYTGYGMTPVALAAITRQTPQEVFLQAMRERLNTFSFCSATQLPIFEREWPIQYELIPLLEYKWRATNVSLIMNRPIWEWMGAYPLRRCRVQFHKISHYHYISPFERRRIRFAFTLGLSPEEAKPYLISPEELAEVRGKWKDYYIEPGGAYGEESGLYYRPGTSARTLMPYAYSGVPFPLQTNDGPPKGTV